MISATLLFSAFCAAQAVVPPAPGRPAASDPRAADKLAALLGDPAAARDAKAAALAALTYDEVRDVDGWLGSFTPDQEIALARSLTDIVETSSYGDGTRLRAVRVWGSYGRWLKDSTAISDTVEELTRCSGDRNPQNQRAFLRIQAMSALATLADKVPSFDAPAARLLLNAGFDSLREAYQPQERTLAMRLLFFYVRGHGAGELQRTPELLTRLRGEVVDPLKTGLDRMYEDRNAYDAEYRARLYGLLYRLAYSYTGDQSLRWDCAQILRRADEERLEREPQLAQILHYYAAGIPR